MVKKNRKAAKKNIRAHSCPFVVKNPPPQPPFPIDKYNAAIAKERDARDFAFLGVDTEICGVAARLMTLRMFIQLCYAKSPFLVGGPVGPEHVAQILWRLSPQYKTTRRGARARFIKSIASLPYAESRKAVEEYLDLIFFDAPPSSGKNKVPRVSFATQLIDFFGHHYGWTRNETLDSPLPELFQLMKEINRRTNPDAVSINRLSDKVKAEWARELEAWAKQNESANGRTGESAKL